MLAFLFYLLDLIKYDKQTRTYELTNVWYAYLKALDSIGLLKMQQEFTNRLIADMEKVAGGIEQLSTVKKRYERHMKNHFNHLRNRNKTFLDEFGERQYRLISFLL